MLFIAKKSVAAELTLCLCSVKFREFHCVSQNSYRKKILSISFQVARIYNGADKEEA